MANFPGWLTSPGITLTLYIDYNSESELSIEVDVMFDMKLLHFV